MRLAGFLGRPVGALLEWEALSARAFVRQLISTDTGPVIRYEVHDGSCEVVCDARDTVEAVILRRGPEVLPDVSFTETRAEMVSRWGAPQASGPARRSGDERAYGPWDRFDLGRDTLHVEYRLDGNGLERLTLIWAGALRGGSISPVDSG